MDVTQLLQAAYKKLKADIFFDKTQLILRNRIVKYECSQKFDLNFNTLANEILNYSGASPELSEILNSVTFKSFLKLLLTIKTPISLQI